MSPMIHALRTATSREAAYALLAPLSAASLRQLCREEGIPFPSGATKAALRQALVSTLVGVRLNDGAITRNARAH